MTETVAETTAAARANEKRLARVRARLTDATNDDPRARVIFLLTHELLRGRSEVPDRPAKVATRSLVETPASRATPGEYARLVARVQETVDDVLPPGSRILVVSRGDAALLSPGFEASHFPQGPSGEYAGFYPRDSSAAIGHLDECRTAGAEFLVIPATGYWWLDYYGELAKHLLVTGRVTHHDDHCLIFDLRAETQGRITA